jgi:hypothetical protein
VVLPSAFVLESVSVAAAAAEVAVAGGPVGVGDHVIEIAFLGEGAAVGAGDVAGFDVVGEVLGWPVFGPSVVEQLPGEGVGDQTPPGGVGVEGDGPGEVGRDGPVSGEVTGVVGHAE